VLSTLPLPMGQTFHDLWTILICKMNCKMSVTFTAHLFPFIILLSISFLWYLYVLQISPKSSCQFKFKINKLAWSVYLDNLSLSDWNYCMQQKYFQMIVESFRTAPLLTPFHLCLKKYFWKCLKGNGKMDLLGRSWCKLKEFLNFQAED